MATKSQASNASPSPGATLISLNDVQYRHLEMMRSRTRRRAAMATPGNREAVPFRTAPKPHQMFRVVERAIGSFVAGAYNRKWQSRMLHQGVTLDRGRAAIISNR
jgi:hypothetical protein